MHAKVANHRVMAVLGGLLTFAHKANFGEEMMREKWAHWIQSKEVAGEKQMYFQH